MSRIEARLAPPDSVFRAIAASTAVMRSETRRTTMRPRAIALWVVVTDALVVLAALATTAVVPGAGLSSLGLNALVFVGWQVALIGTRLRAGSASRADAGGPARVIAATGIVFGTLAVSAIALDVPMDRALFTITLPLGTVLLLGSHSLWRSAVRALQHAGRLEHAAVVVASPEDADGIVNGLRRDRAASTTVVDVVTDFDDAVALARRAAVDTVIVGPTAHGGDVRRLAWRLEGTRATLVLATRTSDVDPHRLRLETREGLALLSVRPARFNGASHVAKRVFDVSASALALIALAPLMACIAAVIRIDSAGPALFRQTRVGKNGETFTMLKFRSMVNDAERGVEQLRELNDASGFLFKMHDDPRVTRVGAFIRRHSLDELPQLINILRGDMSIVGPRPPLPREVSSYEGDVHRRLLIRPGLTGLWQISGRSDLSWDDSVRLDLNYVENWSLFGDVRVIAKTVSAVVRPVGAY
ncbi:sugar transferase [Paramicrobacterium agarici]|uniref:sugar transferase n=1 Tax=Paramicrobacterium agarici TaxID=630514 RepID=UPI001153A8D8|nr:sugar transferase [Microbacterium agarici]TQO23442.1 exopolysaccharide biosynthesis polyprenyl glycosylphosphotransferase [Microbacterium agarici]